MTLNRNLMLALAASLIGLASLPAQAAPCELERNQYGVWSGDCTLDDYFKYKLAARLMIPQHILRLNLPDLIGNDGDYPVTGTTVEVWARTENQGTADARDYEVMAEVEISGGNLSQPQMVVLTARAQPLARGARQWTSLGHVTVPDRMYDYDITTHFTVDSRNASTGGEVWELDETNNGFFDGTCRVYGKNPDTSVGPCQ